MVMKKTYCDRCGEELKDNNIDEHLHGYPYAMTYMPGLYMRDLIK